MKATNPNQTTIDIALNEQDLLHQAAKLIQKAMDLKESSSVRKFEHLVKDFTSVQTLQLLQAVGNTMYLSKWDNLLIESHKSAWKMNYHFTYPPS